ncbi:MAG: carboxypeptidase regulatory-like domain-containing protein [Myxococcales bacterium]|jgi:protocatechuate 3,4-dioxygenase beta subunit
MSDSQARWVFLAAALLGGAVGWTLWTRGYDPSADARHRAGSPPEHRGPGPAGHAAIEGFVHDERGEPLAGVELVLRAGSDDEDVLRASGLSDEAGHFRIGALAPGRYQLEAEAPGHDPTVLPEVQVPADGPLEVVLQRSAGLFGVVLRPDGRAAPGAEVVIAGSGLWPPQVLTVDGDGEFRLPSLPGGVYELRAHSGELTSKPVEGVVVEAGEEASVEIPLVPGATLRGRVYDAATGEGLADASVRVLEDALTAIPVELSTDAEGRFEVGGLRALPHRVSVAAPGYVTQTGMSLSPGAPDGQEVPQEVPIPMRQAAVISGRVLDEAGDPVAGAELEVIGTTDVGGPLQLSEAATRFQLDLLATRAPPDAVGAVLAGDNLGVTRGPVPRVPLRGSVAVGREAGDSAPGAAPVGLRTGADGRFEIPGVPPGRVQILARRDGFAPGRSAVHAVVAGTTLQDVEIVLPEGGVVAGRVLDADGYPVEGVRMSLQVEGEPLSRVTLSDSDGAFELSSVRGKCVLTAHRPGEPPVAVTARVAGGERRELTLTLPGQVYTVEGRVLDDREFPVVSAMIHLDSLDPRHPLSRTTTSAEDGTFRLAGLPAPPYRLHVEHHAHAPLELESLTPPEGEPLQLVLDPGATLRGSVRDAHHARPLPGAQVRIEGEGERHETTSNTSGQFRFSNLTPGKYDVFVTRDGFLDGRDSTRIEGDTDATLEPIALSPAGAVSGVVVDRFGAPVFNAEVATGSPTDWARAVRTDHLGHFRIHNLAPGEHRVQARHARAGVARDAVEVQVHRLQETPGLVLRLPGDPGEPTAASEEQPSSERAGAGTPPAPVMREGVAVSVHYRDGGVRVQAVVPGSRAERAGLRAGDRIVTLDDEPVLAAAQARSMLRGPAGSQVVLGVRRGEQDRRLVVRRERFEAP